MGETLGRAPEQRFGDAADGTGVKVVVISRLGAYNGASPAERSAADEALDLSWR